MGKGSGEEELDGFLVGEGGNLGEGRGVDLGVFCDVFDHEGAEGDVLCEVGEDPAAVCDVDLFQGDGASGVDVCDHAPAKIDAAEDAAFHAG